MPTWVWAVLWDPWGIRYENLFILWKWISKQLSHSGNDLLLASVASHSLLQRLLFLSFAVTLKGRPGETEEVGTAVGFATRLWSLWSQVWRWLVRNAFIKPQSSWHYRRNAECLGQIPPFRNLCSLSSPFKVTPGEGYLVVHRPWFTKCQCQEHAHSHFSMPVFFTCGCKSSLWLEATGRAAFILLSFFRAARPEARFFRKTYTKASPDFDKPPTLCRISFNIKIKFLTLWVEKSDDQEILGLNFFVKTCSRAAAPLIWGTRVLGFPLGPHSPSCTCLSLPAGLQSQLPLVLRLLQTCLCEVQLRGRWGVDPAFVVGQTQFHELVLPLPRCVVLGKLPDPRKLPFLRPGGLQLGDRM